MKQLMTVLACSMALLSTSAFANAHKEAPDMKKTRRQRADVVAADQDDDLQRRSRRQEG
jgi:hypothetical protein